ncbi:MAG: hypothetical protein ACFFB5_05590 [Promethearchaeota archaeon]
MKEAKLFQFIALISIVTLAPMLTGTKILPAIPANVKVDEIPGEIGPGTLPDWHEDAQVQLGWIFDDPTNPQESTPLPGWDKAIGDIPVWSYIPNRTAFGYPAQWYIRIPNLINDNPSKKFWISWVYEFDTYLPEGLRSATNLEWYPDSGHGEPQYLEEWFDSDGELTTDFLQATHARVTQNLDLYPNPQYEDVWLGVYGGSKNAVEVYIKTLCVEEVEPVTIGPGTLPDWHEDAQVQLGWIFDDPTNPQNTSPLPGWDKAIGDTPVWSYNPNQTILDQPGQWYIRIPNLDNDNPAKKVWISWVYEFDPYFEGVQAATNLDWYPNSGSDNPQILEEWFDGEGVLTTNQSEVAYGRITGGLDLYPNPLYEDIWLGLYNSLNAREVYIKTLCVTEPKPEIDVDVEVTLILKLSPDTFEFTTDIELGSNSEIEVSTNIKLTSNGIEVTADISLGTNNLEIAMNFGLNSSFGEELGVIINIKLKTSEDGMEIITDFEMNTPSSVIQTVIDMNIGPDSFEFSSDVDLSSSFDNIEVSTNFSLNPGGISASTDIDLDSIEAVLDILLISGTNPS